MEISRFTRLGLTAALICMLLSVFFERAAPWLNLATLVLLAPCLIFGAIRLRAYALLLVLPAAVAVHRDAHEAGRRAASPVSESAIPASAAVTTEDIHPLALRLIQSWPSDSGEPLFTEINLDAIRQNQNQFPTSDVKRDGEWIRYEHRVGDNETETIRYKPMRPNGPSEAIELQWFSSEGRIVWHKVIEFKRASREIDDGTRRQTRVLQITAMRTIPNG